MEGRSVNADTLWLGAFLALIVSRLDRARGEGEPPQAGQVRDCEVFCRAQSVTPEVKRP